MTLIMAFRTESFSLSISGNIWIQYISRCFLLELSGYMVSIHCKMLSLDLSGNIWFQYIARCFHLELSGCMVSIHCKMLSLDLSGNICFQYISRCFRLSLIFLSKCPLYLIKIRNISSL